MKKRAFALKKSSREKKRYFLLESDRDYSFEIRDTFIFLFGIFKTSESCLKIKTSGTKRLLQINLEFEKELQFCIYYLNKTKNSNIKLAKTSGTILSLTGVKNVRKRISNKKKK